jgi:Winged helix-turn helix
MGQAIPVRTDYTAGEVRRFAQRAKDAAQARRLLAIAAVLDGVSREGAAKIGGMDRQTLRDWVIRSNEQGADGLINNSFSGECRPSSTLGTRPFSPESWRRVRSLRSMAWCAGGRAI